MTGTLTTTQTHTIKACYNDFLFIRESGWYIVLHRDSLRLIHQTIKVFLLGILSAVTYPCLEFPGYYAKYNIQV